MNSFKIKISILKTKIIILKKLYFITAFEVNLILKNFLTILLTTRKYYWST